MNKILERDKKYNQKKYVEYLLNNGYMISDPKNYCSNLRLITIYLKDNLGMKPKQREEYVYNFVKQNDPFYNEVTDYVKIDRALKMGSKGKLRVIEPVTIYKYEFDIINSFPLNINRKRILFSAYCFYKLKNKMYPNLEGNPYIPSGIVTLAKLKATSKVKDDIRFYLNELEGEYFDWTPSNDTSIILPFAPSIRKPTEEDLEFYTIVNYDDLHLYYDLFLGDESISFCESCGAAFRDRNYKKAGARQKYCKDCGGYQKQEKRESVCECCGRPYFIDPKSRRKKDLCDECYEAQRSKDRHTK